MLRSGGAWECECPVPGLTVTQGAISLLTLNLPYILVKVRICCHLCWGDERGGIPSIRKSGVTYTGLCLWEMPCPEEQRQWRGCSKSRCTWAGRLRGLYHKYSGLKKKRDLTSQTQPSEASEYGKSTPAKNSCFYFSLRTFQSCQLPALLIERFAGR